MRSLIISDRRLLHGLRASPFAQRWRVLDAAAYALAAPQDVFDPTNDYLSEAVMDMNMGINEALLVYIFGDSVLDKCPGEGNTSFVSRALDALDGISAGGKVFYVSPQKAAEEKAQKALEKRVARTRQRADEYYARMTKNRGG